METPEIRCYFLLLKKRHTNTLSQLKYLADSAPYATKCRHNLLRFLQVNGILLAEYIAYCDIYNYILLTLSMLHEQLSSPLELLEKKFPNSFRIETVFNHAARQLIHQQQNEFRDNMIQSLHHIGLTQTEINHMEAELNSAFDFLLQIQQLVPFRNGVLVIVSSTSTLSFPRFLPANHSFSNNHRR